jgi:hypothetical protein
VNIVKIYPEHCCLWTIHIAGANIVKILSKNHIYAKTCIEKDSFKLYNNTSNILLFMMLCGTEETLHRVSRLAAANMAFP